LSKIIKLSASAVKTYTQCPRKYYFTYIKKAPKQKHDYFDLGNVCHKTLEIFHEEYMNNGLSKHKTLNELMGFSFKKARQEYKKVSIPIISDAKKLLINYLSSVKKSGMPIVKGVEASFDFNIDSNIRIRGFVDRVDIMDDGRFNIIDYKTTKSVQYLDDFQLLVYGLWLKREFTHVDSFKGTYVLLRHNSARKEFDFNYNDVEKVERLLIKCAEQIDNEIRWTPVPTRLCNWCDFKGICPAQQSW